MVSTRREFLARLLGASAWLAGALAAGGCQPSGPSQAELDSMRAAMDPKLDCTNTSGLWPAEAATRTTNAYVEHSAKADQFCQICLNFQPPAAAGACGSCTTVKGPINPGGWCTSWTAKRT